MELPFKKQLTPDLSKIENQTTYIREARDPHALFQKEMDVNLVEQDLLKHRINLMNQLVNDLPDFDPQYAVMRYQIQMDQIELDELKIRETEIARKLNTIL